MLPPARNNRAIVRPWIDCLARELALSRAACIACAIILQCLPKPCVGASWSLGSHFGFSSIRSSVSGSGSSSILGVPANPLSYQPGLRLAVADSLRGRQVALDLGLMALVEGGAGFSVTTVHVDYVRALRAENVTAVLATAGAGVVREGGGDRASYAASFGAGLGVRRLVRDSHGAVRVETRVDWLLKDGIRERPRLTILTARLGFDLWL